MSSRLSHRGPDGSGSYSSDLYSLRHRRLAIIDVEGGKQPMVSEDGRYVLAFNGEIYNYIELRSELEGAGCHFHTKSDTEVLLLALMKWGHGALPRLNGMFAFAFLDTVKSEWLLARDPIGIKPLYWFKSKEEFVFASEIKALKEHPSFVPRVDSVSLQQYLTFQFCIRRNTLFEDCNRLEPGTWISGSEERILGEGRFWESDYRVDKSRSDDDFLEELNFLLADAAGLQIRSDARLGCYLSGGLDSSFITAMASEAIEEDLPLFHGRFQDPAGYDESGYAKAIAGFVGGELHFTEPKAEDFVDELPRIVYQMDEPLAGPGVFPQYLVSRDAAKRVKVVLGGQGGDEVFAGYARYLVAYLEQALKGSIFRTQEEGQHIVTLSSIVPNLTVLKQYKPLMSRFLADGLFDPMDRRYFRLIDRLDGSLEGLSGELRANFDQEGLFETFSELFNHPQTKSYINKMLHFDMRTMLPSLLHVEDRVSMAWGLESRVPLLDTRIVDLVNKMPPAMKFKGGRTKYAFKKVAENRLPKSILERKDKMGFPVPLHEWMKKEPVKSFARDVLLSKKSRERGIYDAKALEGLIDSDRPFSRAIWGALNLELWHQAFIDG